MKGITENGAEGLFGQRDEIIGGWGELHNEEFHDFNSSLDITAVIKSRRVRWTGHVAHGRYEKCMQNLLTKPEMKKLI
jgi:hypothetical protein